MQDYRGEEEQINIFYEINNICLTKYSMDRGCRAQAYKGREEGAGDAPETHGPWSAHSMTHISMKRVAYLGS